MGQGSHEWKHCVIPSGDASADLVKESVKELAATQKLLGLNIIVGPGEEVELERCLQSVGDQLFDEIVITVTSEDENVRKVAEKYADKVPFFRWIDDFSAARNYSFSQNTTKYVLWLDADDVIKPEQLKKLIKFKEKRLRVEELDIVLIDYIYSHDDKDAPVLTLPRERIVRKCDKIKWHDPIHEYMNMHADYRIERVDIAVDHYRTRPFDAQRNLDLLKKEIDKGKPTARIKFYYGKELCDVGKWEEAVPVLEEYGNKGDGFRDNLTVACIRLAQHYLRNNEREPAKNFALKGIRFNSIYAENFVLIGSMYEMEGDQDTAVKYLKDALTKKLTGGMSQIVDYYGFIPAAKLATIFLDKKEYEEGLKYCELALKHKPDAPQMVELKRILSTELEKRNLGSTLQDDDIVTIKKYLEEELKFSVELTANHIDYADIRLKKKQNLEIVWLMPSLDLDNPSIRIRRYNVSEKMKSMGVSSRMIVNYYEKNVFDLRNEIADASVVIFTSYGPLELELMKYLKPLRKKIIFDHCEGLFGYPCENECMAEADIISCCSTKLAELTNKHGISHTVVLKDSVEERQPTVERVYTDRYVKPKAVFMGMGGNSFLVTQYLKEEIERAGYELVVMTEWDDATIKWNRDTWPDDMSRCDVALCPQRVDVQPGKSSVKVTTAMALGMPVLASPLQAYKEIIEHGVNGYICERKEDWYTALIELKDPKKREEVGAAAVKSVESYSLDNIAQQWITTLDDLINERLDVVKAPEPEKEPEVSRDIVDIIIPNYNNEKYLKLCVSSILMNTLYPFHIVISDAGSDEETWKYLNTLKGITVLGKTKERRTFSETCNAGILTSRTRFFVVLNSDTIVSKGWLTNLVDKMTQGNRRACCGVLSNCDRGWLHDNPKDPNSPKYPMRLPESGVELHPGMKFETMKPHLEELQAFMEKSNEQHKGKYVSQLWIAAYAAIYARSAVNEIGLFDTQFKNGCEDLDLCIRLAKQGFVCGHAIDSFVYHFGGISRGAYEKEMNERDLNSVINGGP